MPRYSPDGKWIAFERDSQRAARHRSGDEAEKLLATGVFDTPPFVDARDFAWSPDSRCIAYLTAGAKAFQNVHVVPVGRRRGGAPVELSREHERAARCRGARTART